MFIPVWLMLVIISVVLVVHAIYGGKNSGNGTAKVMSLRKRGFVILLIWFAYFVFN
jgi:hypothetical protein